MVADEYHRLLLVFQPDFDAPQQHRRSDSGSLVSIWMSFMLGIEISESRNGQPAAAFNNLLSVLDTVLSVGCLLTYLATAAFAAAMGGTGWLSPGSKGAYAT